MTDLYSIRVLRLTFGIAIATALAHGLQWAPPFLVAVLVGLFLARPIPCPDFRTGVRTVLSIGAASVIGLLIAVGFLPYPLLCLIVIGAALFGVFYWAQQGAPLLAVVMLLIGVMIIPMMGLQSLQLAFFMAWILFGFGVTALLIVWFAHAVLPDPRATESGKKAVKPESKLLPIEERLPAAARNFAVVFPVVVLFYLYEWTGATLVLVFIALLAQMSTFAEGAKGGAAMVVANLIGGFVAIVIYNLIVAVPSFVFFLLLMALTTLLLGKRIFSNHPRAGMYPTALNCTLILVGTTVTTDVADASSALYVRLAQIALATLYMAAMAALLEQPSPLKKRPLPLESPP